MNHVKIYLILIAVMFVWGLNLPAVKYLTTQVGPVTMTSMRIFIAAVMVFAILHFMGLVRKPNRKEWGYIIAGAMLNVVIHHYFISVGLTMTTGSNAGLILGTGPMLTAIFGSLLLRMIPSVMQWLGFIFGLAGVTLTVIAGSGSATMISLGDLFVFISVIVQVLSFLVISKASKTLDPRLLTGYMFLIGSLFLFVISIIQEPKELRAFQSVTPMFWIAFFTSGMFATAIGHMLYNFAVGKVGPAKSAIFINLNTLFALLGSVVMLGEEVTIVHLIGLVLIVSSVLLGSGAVEELWMKRKEKQHSIQA
ncbi:DMT family transporter [Metabacillus herbersteinensis]|uniref:DMT family transporter n=1 Tax=Metabacillus herbersteinensis TaxID=283816 RepID=A0ABV6GDR8_9BACI